MWEQPEKSGIVLHCISHEGIFWEKLGMAVITVISGFVVYTRLLGQFPLYWPISLVWMQPKTKEALPAGSTVITAIDVDTLGFFESL